jgi:hypothetical protein
VSKDQDIMRTFYQSDHQKQHSEIIIQKIYERMRKLKNTRNEKISLNRKPRIPPLKIPFKLYLTFTYIDMLIISEIFASFKDMGFVTQHRLLPLGGWV